jgi:type II secretory pathway pseudopilin PulG
MDTAIGILILTISVISIVGVGVAFVWAARKDGEEDRALQKRLGIRRKTRLGP